MPVDEFGREIPQAGRPSSPSPPRRHHHRDDDYDARARRRSRSCRSRSPSPSRRRGSSPTATTAASRHQHHASVTYVREPMLCEYLWKQQQQQQQQQQDDGNDTREDETKTKDKDDSYDDYRHGYCLNYVRSFFNHHLDDSWFRQSYSPLERRRRVQLERARAAEQAKAILDAWNESAEAFVAQARLGEGVKAVGVEHNGGRKRQRDDSQTPNNAIPKSHVSSILDQTIAIHEVPPHVSEDHLRRAMAEVVSLSSVEFHSSTPDATSNRKTLYRSVFCVLDSVDQREELVSQLHHSHREGQQQSHPSTTAAATPAEGHVPRHREDIPTKLDLQVNCSDPYSRLELDGDGKGGPPDAGVVPPPNVQVPVVVSTPPLSQPRVMVLSAALSSTERISRDKEAALMLARALDVSRSIPNDFRLDVLMELSVIDSDADCLDVAIAYLRRVHLFSFYNGCTVAKNLGDVLTGQHGSSTIHLRLKNADELLHGEGGDVNEDTGPDLLVQRLDDNIATALEQSNDWVARAGHFVDETQDLEAVEMEELEEKTKKEWMENHSIVDDDGRARCRFHFCKKLFKDDRFLKKHLVKKHGEFLAAEVGKCHDSFMMKAWDEETQRPVPPVLVDCGTSFGRVPSAVVGAEPTACDPEPELWSREEERRAAAAEREESNFQRYEERGRDRRESRGGDSAMGNDGPVEETGARGGGGFVDVDDMKDDRVELSFENVQVESPPPKKKRKKKKLL